MVIRVLLMAASCVAVLPAHGGDDKKPTSRYEIRKDHDPDGIGKFYLGREIAHCRMQAEIVHEQRFRRVAHDRFRRARGGDDVGGVQQCRLRIRHFARDRLLQPREAAVAIEDHDVHVLVQGHDA